MRKHAVVPPFRALEPELGVTERLLRQGNPALTAVAGLLPDEQAAARRLNGILAEAGARPRLVGTGSAWRIVYVGTKREGELVEAAAGMAELVAVGGWRRVKHCEACDQVFCDRTSGCTRRWCVDHRR
ncbi:hypothetical protein SAMN05421504_102379 [Amycolatopsis xylanica]|uniref:Uncharacterized protein n=1 Tax=Amycolatopsis xylanica TaxID=589385 RepID=A0A1H2Z4Z0_9PSEU|nr:hypothetical protein [Amycolatopsis xylanica]SDX12401.1 hypothetical protein SAMN05421504_102379 [Amycolatopsis xylanica]